MRPRHATPPSDEDYRRLARNRAIVWLYGDRPDRSSPVLAKASRVYARGLALESIEDNWKALDEGGADLGVVNRLKNSLLTGRVDVEISELKMERDRIGPARCYRVFELGSCAVRIMQQPDSFCPDPDTLPSNFIGSGDHLLSDAWEALEAFALSLKADTRLDYDWITPHYDVELLTDFVASTLIEDVRDIVSLSEMQLLERLRGLALEEPFALKFLVWAWEQANGAKSNPAREYAEYAACAGLEES